MPTQDAVKTQEAKTFKTPSENMAGIYFFRDSLFGMALKKDIRIDGKCIGETAPNTFFYVEVEGDKTHQIATESEFSDNILTLNTEKGMLYFIRQYIKMGVFVGGANLEEVSTDEAKEIISDSSMKLALSGNCSNG
ncbi:DUF2846 domain-containing protein [Thorsellia anophelis]|uniref:DUF2846 domain-containing protein n=1 Tax=Thorsellia anophelis TaxID=336804 RepID=UPI001FE0FAA3|nr:DUF2846 domain-containing protein [Thorsellia anophelis]